MSASKKHAYLIVAHHEFDMLKMLIRSLDHERNDVYVMVDAKAKDFAPEEFENITRRSGLFFAKRMPIYWGAFSLTEAYLSLMRVAHKKEYAYYHVLSGVDFPLKTQEEIHGFFDRRQGTEFIETGKSIWEMKRDYDSSASLKQKWVDLLRMKEFEHGIYYYPAQKHLNLRRGKIANAITGAAGRLAVAAQKITGFVRNKNTDIRRGSAWYSITHNLLSLVIDKQEFIEKTFRHTACSDEHFVQTILQNSPLRDNVYRWANANLRYIDWTKPRDLGYPYVFRITDYDDLINSGCFFARKFSMSVDSEIVNRLYDNLRKNQHQARGGRLVSQRSDLRSR